MTPGKGGNDTVAFAAAGDDRLDGGPGDDIIQGGVDSCANGEVLVSCEASAAAASRRLAATTRATRDYGRQ